MGLLLRLFRRTAFSADKFRLDLVSIRFDVLVVELLELVIDVQVLVLIGGAAVEAEVKAEDTEAAAATLADLVMLKFVTIWDMDAGLSVLVRVATEVVEDQEDKVENEATILAILV